MKKFMLPILLFLLFIPLYVNAETCDTDKISISSISLDKKSENVTEVEKTTANGKNINLNLSMSEVGDNIEYKIVIKNDSNEDYDLDKNSINISSDYIDYSFDSEDNNKIIKAKTSKTIYLKVQYKNEVPGDQFISGTYNEKKNMTLNLSTNNTTKETSNLQNPNTGVQSYFLISIIIIITSLFIYVVLKKQKRKLFIILITGIVTIIPIRIYALCKSEINILSNINIKEKEYNITYYSITCSHDIGCYNVLLDGGGGLPTKATAGTKFDWTFAYYRQCYYTDLEGNELGKCWTIFYMPPQDIIVYFEYS